MADDIDGMLRLTKAWIKPAAEMLCKAFRDYPVFTYFYPGEAKRNRMQPAVFRGLVRSGMKHGEVYATSPALEGAAVWFGPDSQHDSRWEYFWSGQFFTMMFTGRETLARQITFSKYASEVRMRSVPKRHWYLQMLGVDPNYQGRGYASKLLKPMLARADREGVPCFLETQAEKNVAFYEHFGFRVVEAGIIPGSDMKSWGMLRGNE